MDTLIRILLSCLLCAHVYADTCPVYNVLSSGAAGVGLDDLPVRIVMNSKLLFKTASETKITNSPVPYDYTSVDASLQSLNIIVKKGTSTVNLNNCPTLQKTIRELSEPFSVFYRNGLFEYLQVPKNNDNLSVNLKLLVSELLQVDKALVRDDNSAKSAQTKEETIFGSCNVKYDDITAGQPLPDKNVPHDVRISKNVDLKSCSNANKPIDSSSLNEICNPLNQKNILSDLREVLNIGVILPTNKTIKEVSLMQSIFYNPWKASTLRMSHNISTQLDLHPFEQNCNLVHTLTKNDSEKVTEPRYTPVDESLVNAASSDPIQKVYSALACDPYNSNIYLEIYQHALKCAKA